MAAGLPCIHFSATALGLCARAAVCPGLTFIWPCIAKRRTCAHDGRCERRVTFPTGLPPFTSATVNSNCRLWLCRALRWPPPHFGFGHAAGPARALAAAAAAAAVAAATALTDLTALTECRSCHPRHPCLWPWIRRWADRRRSQSRTHRTVRRRSPSARAAAGRSGLKA